MLWLWDHHWPELIHPFASAIDTELPEPAEMVCVMESSKPAWMRWPEGKKSTHTLYNKDSLEEWHKKHGYFVAWGIISVRSVFEPSYRQSRKVYGLKKWRDLLCYMLMPMMEVLEKWATWKSWRNSLFIHIWSRLRGIMEPELRISNKSQRIMSDTLCRQEHRSVLQGEYNFLSSRCIQKEHSE